MSAYTISVERGLDCEHLVSTLAPISDAAFRRPPWNMNRDHDSMIRQFLTFPQAAVWLGFSDQRCVGFAIGSKLSLETIEYFELPAEAQACVGDYHLTWRAVHPEFQGHGLGRELSQVRVEEAARLGCRRIYTSTLHNNLGTHRMYEAAGFVVCGRKLYVQPGKLSEQTFFVKTLNHQ